MHVTPAVREGYGDSDDSCSGLQDASARFDWLALVPQSSRVRIRTIIERLVLAWTNCQAA